MSRTYKHGDHVPTAVLAARLDELAEAFPDRESRDREFTMRIPAELDRDPDLVMSEASRRLTTLEAQLAAREQELKECREYANRLAVGLVVKHYPEISEWHPLPNLMGILTQIDNATADLQRRQESGDE